MCDFIDTILNIRIMLKRIIHIHKACKALFIIV